MRKNIIIILLLTLNLLNAQTKEETYKYINDKLEVLAINTPDTEQKYILTEIKNNSEQNVISILNVTIIKDINYGNQTLMDESIITPKTIKNINFKKRGNNIWLEIFCDKNAIITNKLKSTPFKRIFNGYNSKTEFILNGDLTIKDKDRLTKAFNHLLKFYNAEITDIFD